LVQLLNIYIYIERERGSIKIIIINMPIRLLPIQSIVWLERQERGEEKRRDLNSLRAHQNASFPHGTDEREERLQLPHGPPI
jgi:hypothetical protein